MSTQAAYRLQSYGGPECVTLDEGLPIPTPGASQVLIKVNTVAINPVDWKIREGYTKDEFPLALPTVLGVDYVGIVTAIGENVTRFGVGDRVMSFSPTLGAWAEYIVQPENFISSVPPELSDIAAATLPIPATTAWKTLYEAGKVEPGSKILIHGASGVVGAFAVQLAKAAGAYVIGTASNKNREYVMSLGADDFVDYRTEKFEDKIHDKIDLVLDYVLKGGDMNTTERSFKVLKEGGAVVTASDPAIQSMTPDGYRGIFPQIMPNPSILDSVARMLSEEKITSKVAEAYPRSRLVEAMKESQVGGRTGRMIVDFTQHE